MPVARCYELALKISRRPRGEWIELIKEIRMQCPHSDCTANNCQEVCRTWLRAQWRKKRPSTK
jgi:hypothetical protein